MKNLNSKSVMEFLAISQSSVNFWSSTLLIRLTLQRRYPEELGNRSYVIPFRKTLIMRGRRNEKKKSSKNRNTPRLGEEKVRRLKKRD